MYADDQARIADHAQTPQGFADVITFVISTINRHFYAVGDVVSDVRLHGIEDNKYLTPLQKKAVRFVRAHAEAFYDIPQRYPDDIDALRALTELPGIGIVKAGFVLQLVAGRTGCLDRWNMRILGLNEKTFQRVPVSAEALTIKLNLYVQTVRAMGTCAQLYDGWCALIAAQYPLHFSSADDVSQKHVLWACNTAV
jgi:hypothetical protein